MGARNTPDINRILRANQRPCKYGAPMGDMNRDDRQGAHLTARLYCQRVRFIDGCYAPDGTYWGAPADLWCVFTYFGAVDALRWYVRAPTRKAALEIFKQQER